MENNKKENEMKDAIKKYKLIQQLIRMKGLFNQDEINLMEDLSIEILVFVNAKYNKENK